MTAIGQYTDNSTFSQTTAHNINYRGWVKSAPDLHRISFVAMVKQWSHSADSLTGRVSLFNPVANISPSSPMSVLDLIQLHYVNGNFEDMINLLRTEIPRETDPENLKNLFFYLVDHLVQKNRPPFVIIAVCEEAIAKCKDAAIVDGALSTPVMFFYTCLLNNLFLLNKYDAVIEKCLELMHNNPNILIPVFFYDALALGYIGNNNYDGAFDTIAHIVINYFSEFDDSQKNSYFSGLKIAMSGMLATNLLSPEEAVLFKMKLDTFRAIADLLEKSTEYKNYLSETMTIMKAGMNP